jgi:putative ABC transport system permease protein
LLKTPPLMEGRWLESADTGTVVLDQVARANTQPDVHAGGTVTLSIAGRPVTLRVAGIVEELFAGANIYISHNEYAQMSDRSGHANLLRIATDRHDQPTRNAVAQDAERLLAAASVDVEFARPSDWQTAVAGGHEFVLIAVVIAIAIITAVVGLIGLGSSMTANVLERTREFGVMHAIGARASAVRAIVLSEAIFTALASCVLALVLALGLTAFVDRSIGEMMFYAPLPFRTSVAAIAIWTVLIVAGAVLATLAPALRASRLTVREALAYV